MASCLLSILDYLKLQDKCAPGEEDMCELNNESLSQMMFRKMEEYNIDLNEELGFDHLKPVEQKRWYKFNIDEQSFYEHDSKNNQRTRRRLIRMAELGMEIVGNGHFGVGDVMSGLYIEMVWSYSDEKFDDYIKWVEELIEENKKKPSENKQADLIIKLAKEIRKQKKTKEEVIQSLISAGILDENLEFSKNYPMLRKFDENNKNNKNNKNG